MKMSDIKIGDTVRVKDVITDMVGAGEDGDTLVTGSMQYLQGKDVEVTLVDLGEKDEMPRFRIKGSYTCFLPEFLQGYTKAPEQKKYRCDGCIFVIEEGMGCSRPDSLTSCGIDDTIYVLEDIENPFEVQPEEVHEEETETLELTLDNYELVPEVGDRCNGCIFEDEDVPCPGIIQGEACWVYDDDSPVVWARKEKKETPEEYNPVVPEDPTLEYAPATALCEGCYYEDARCPGPGDSCAHCRGRIYVKKQVKPEPEPVFVMPRVKSVPEVETGKCTGCIYFTGDMTDCLHPDAERVVSESTFFCPCRDASIIYVLAE